MLVEEELAREASVKIGSNYKCNYQSKDKKASSFEEVHVINHYTKYTPMRTTYTHDLK